MKRILTQLGKVTLIVLGFVALAATFSLFSSRPVAADPDEVRKVKVENTPLPVQGTVEATQSGTWNVGITGTPDVNATIIGTPTVNANVTFPSKAVVTIPTHLSVAPSSLLHLTNCIGVGICTGNFGGSFQALLQVNPDGTESTSAFTIPAGDYFLITDVYYRAAGVPVGSSSSVLLVNPSVGGKLCCTVEFYSVNGSATPDGIVQVKDHLTGGILLSEVPLPVFGPGFSNQLDIFGYLVPIS